MTNGLKDIVLRLQRQRATIDSAIAALEGVDDDAPPAMAKRSGRPKKTSAKRVMSAEGRERIAAAQRKRWGAARRAQRSAKKAAKKR
jgi:hypothetical protein